MGRFVFEQGELYYKNMFSKKKLEARELEMMNHTREKARGIASEIAKKRMGEAYDVAVELLGTCAYSILVFRLIKDGKTLYEHPSYLEIGSFGVDKALDEMDLSFLIKWDAVLQDGVYGVTHEMRDEKKLREYISECTFMESTVSND